MQIRSPFRMNRTVTPDNGVNNLMKVLTADNIMKSALDVKSLNEHLKVLAESIQKEINKNARLQEEIISKMEQEKRELSTLKKQVISEVWNTIGNEQMQLIALKDRVINEIQTTTNEVLKIQKGDKGDTGIPGINADEKKIEENLFNRLVKKIPKPLRGEKGKDAIVDPLGIVDMILKLFKDKKIKFDDIAGLRQEVDIVRRQVVMGGHGGQGSWKHVTPTGTINGVNTVFTLPYPPATNSLLIQLNQGFPIEDVDFTLSGTTITFTVAPPTDSILRAKYM